MSKKKYIDGIGVEALSHLEILAENILEARKSRGLSIEAAARLCLMAKGTYISVEEGRPETSMGAYLAVLDYFGLSQALADVAAPHRDEQGRRLRLMGRGT